MKAFFKKNKKIIVIFITILFLVLLIININRYIIIPDHIHSIDDKPAEQRSDIENITVLERSLQKDPENISIMIQLSDLYLRIENKKAAKKMLNEILEIDPSNKEAGELLKKSE